MTHCAPRLAIVMLLAMAVRAAPAQQFGAPSVQRGDPYAPAGASPAYGPPATVRQPADDLRYPLPQAPTAVGRPNYGLPTGAGPVATQDISAQGPPPEMAPPAGDLFQPGQIVARVGDKFILYGEVSPIVSQMLEPAYKQVTTEAERQEIDKRYREMLTRNVVRQMVETKLMYVEFERGVEKEAGRDKLPEVRVKINKKIQETFETELNNMRIKVAQSKPEELQEMVKRDPVLPRLAILMRDNNAESLSELDAILRRYGSSLEKQVRFYGEYVTGRSSVGKHIRFNPEVTHQEMLDYYTQHAAKYAVPAKARFEILTVKFENYRTRAEAENAIAKMGNEVYYGAPFAAVARKGSQDPHASEGGYYDWTNKGSLASGPIDRAIFTIDVGKLSTILEDERGLHIVRVIERQDDTVVSFLEAQPAIKEAIVAQKRSADTQKFLEMLRTRTEVWTIYDEPTAVAQQPAGTSAR